MLQALKSGFYTLLSPVLDRGKVKNNDNVSLRSYRKRHFSDYHEPEMNTPVKRRRETHSASSLFSMKNWSLTNIFNYVTGTPIEENSPIKKKQELTKNVIKQRKQTYSQYGSPSTLKRNRLKQISKAEVLDLTCLDDSESDDIDITKVSYDLTKPIPRDHAVGSVIFSESSPVISKDTIKRVSSPNNLIEETGRLEERKRYQQILSLYTNVSLPEYSNSIVANENERSHTNSSPRDISVDSIFTSPVFIKKSRALKTPVIDLTTESKFRQQFSNDSHETSFNSSRGTSSIISPKVTPSWQRHSISKTSFVDLTNECLDEESDVLTQRVNKTTVRNNELPKYQPLLDSDWIRKWKETIDPLQLERERLISLEEKKKEALKKKKAEQLEKSRKELEKQKSLEFPDLSNDALSIVKNVLGPGNPGEVFVSGFNAEITRSDLSTLRDTTWLNDEVVNFYFNLIKQRSEKDKNLPKVHVFNTFFYPKIMKSGHAGVKRWTRKINIFEMDVILVPVHLGMHWCLAVIDFKNKQLAYYDSMKGNNMQCLEAMRSYLEAESMDKRKIGFDTSNWDMIIPKDIPEQQNGCDCGVFMSKYAEYKSRDANFTFTQQNMPYFRKRMIYEIVSKKLL